MVKLTKFFLLILVFSGSAASLVGQETNPVCKNMTYENRNQIDYGPLRVGVIKGIAVDSQRVTIPKICVGVFTEAEHKLVATIETNGNGEFELKSLPNGDYRLVAKYPGFCPANARLRVQMRSHSKRKLTVHMKPAGIDICSYVDQR
jgi:hypothetical protein